MSNKKNLSKLLVVSVLCVLLMSTFSVTYAGGVGNLIKSNSSSSSGSSSYSSSSRRSSSSSSGIGLSAPVLLILGAVYVVGKNGRKMNLPKEIVEPCETACKIFDQYKSGKLFKGETIITLQDINNTEYISSEIIRWDENFNADQFIAWTKEVFFKVNEAWSNKDWSVIRPFEHESLFELHNGQLNEYIQNGTRNIIKNISVDNAYLYTYNRDNTRESIKVVMYTYLISYVIDEETQQVIGGDSKNTIEMTYVLTFMRNKNVKTSDKSNKSTSQCPVCGAPTEITSAGKCEYCQNIITTGDHDWVMTHFDAMDESFVVDPTPVTIIATNEKSNGNSVNRTYCTECGEPIENSNFCGHCGNKVEREKEIA